MILHTSLFNGFRDRVQIAFGHGIQQRLLVWIILYIVPTETPARAEMRVVVSRVGPSASKA